MKRTLLLNDINVTERRLNFSFIIDEMKFNTSYWYDTVDFKNLQQRFGNAAIERIIFHIAAFEINKLASLRPEIIDFGAWSKYVDDEFATLWTIIFKNVWAQWRYENNITDYITPEIRRPDFNAELGYIKEHGQGDPGLIWFCGGGKDSLVSMQILSETDTDFDSLSYSSSIYGTAARQHSFSEELLAFGCAETHHRQWIFDDFLDSPILELASPEAISTLTAAETPSSVFASIPIVLASGHRHIALGHERSADTGQVFWEATGEDINHQWGKSYDAESLINTYIQRNLVANFEYFSILKPLYDTMVFYVLSKYPEIIPHAHSCNVQKPWCRRCPKCCYVWLGYNAFLDHETVVETFGDENLFDVPENLNIFRQLAGFESQLPFECIGQENESRMFFELATHRGCSGLAIKMYETERPKLDVPRLVEKYTTIYWDDSSIPKWLQDRMQKILNPLSNQLKVLLEDTLTSRESK